MCEGISYVEYSFLYSVTRLPVSRKRKGVVFVKRKRKKKGGLGDKPYGIYIIVGFDHISLLNGPCRSLTFFAKSNMMGGRTYREDMHAWQFSYLAAFTTITTHHCICLDRSHYYHKQKSDNIKRNYCADNYVYVADYYTPEKSP